MAAKKTKPDFEASLAQLENIVTSMESGDLSLEDALGAFEKGIKLTRECQQALEAAEQKIQILTRSADGLDAEGLQAEPFETEDPSET